MDRPRMLRITQSPDTKPTFTVEGQLIGPWVDELQRITFDAGGAEYIRLDLRNVTFADAAGVALLRRLRSAGAELRGCSAFLGTLIGGDDGAG